MDIKIEKPVKGGTIKAIASKSQAHRLLICAALSDSETHVKCSERSDDIDATVSCLKSLGAVFARGSDAYTVTPIPSVADDRVYELDCRESGTTYRFMLPVAASLGASCSFTLRGRLPERPAAPLIDALNQHGCEISGIGSGTVSLRGRLTSGVYNLPGGVSSQFISGLLLALPLVNGGGTVIVDGVTESLPYINMTLDALRQFGIAVRTENGQYSIPETARYVSPGDVSVEGDWSNAAFWLCAGAAGHGKITCTGLNLKSSQGDMAVVAVLRRFGAEISLGGDSVTVSPSGLNGISIDARDVPDLVPVLAAAASVAEGETVIYNAGRLRIKESDRLTAVSKTLSALGADIRETNDGLIINGKPKLSGGTVSSFGDHRIAMMAAVASSVCENAVVIRGAEAVSKSYPGFFEDFKKLGGVCSEV